MSSRDKKESKGLKNQKITKKSQVSFVTKIIRFLRSERFVHSLGLLLVLLSLFFLISFISFLFTWDNDQSYLLNNYSTWWQFLIYDSPNPPIMNWLGKLGALSAHLIIFNGFGIASFAFVIVFFILGFKALFSVSLLPIKRTIKFSLFVIIWLSIVLGSFTFASTGDVTGVPVRLNLGGVFGFEVTEWLNTFAGSVGCIFILCFSLFGFVIIAFNPSFAWVKKLFTKKDKDVEVKVSIEEKDSSNNETLDSGSKISLDNEILQSENQESIDEEKNSINLTTDITDDKLSSKNINDLTVEIVENPEEKFSDTNDKQKEYGNFDPTLDLSKYQPPTLNLLKDYGVKDITINRDELEKNKNKILSTLSNYNIEIAHIKAAVGPTVTLYEIIPAPGVRISKIRNLENDIALSLAALGIRIIAPIPGKGTIGIEVPNSNPEMVPMRSLIASEKFQNSKYELPIILGKTISNENFIADLAKMPHLLMAGATGQGKSVGLNAIIASLIYKKHPSQLKFVFVDPKKVELTLYNKIERHFLAKLPGDDDAIISDTSKVINTVNSLCSEMDQRFSLLKEAMVRNIIEYNAKFVARKLSPEKGHRYMPYIVLIIDEFADLIMTAGKQIETPIARLAQLARAVGIHLIVATQRPSTNIITGTIKANFPARVAFRVTSQIDSRTILDSGGAEQLIGKGDLLISNGSDLIRMQCGFIDTPEVEAICEFIGEQQGYATAYQLPECVDEVGGQGSMTSEERDSMFEQAASIIVIHQQGSASLLQRKLKLGYNRAGRIIDQLESAGIIGPFEGSKPRRVLIPDEASLENLLSSSNEE